MSTSGCRARASVRRAGVRGAAGGRADLRARAVCVACVGVGVVSEAAGDAGAAGGGREADYRAGRPADGGDVRHGVYARGRIRIAGTSRSSRAATSSAPTAWCRTRGERSGRGRRTSVLAEARRMADAGFTEIQLLGQNVNSYRDPSGQAELCGVAGGGGRGGGDSAGAVYDARIRGTLRGILWRPSTRCRRCAIMCICRCSRDRREVLAAMAREYTREWYLERIAWIKAARREISMTTDMIVGFPGETEAGSRRDGDAAG